MMFNAIKDWVTTVHSNDAHNAPEQELKSILRKKTNRSTPKRIRFRKSSEFSTRIIFPWVEPEPAPSASPAFDDECEPMEIDEEWESDMNKQFQQDAQVVEEEVEEVEEVEEEPFVLRRSARIKALREKNRPLRRSPRIAALNAAKKKKEEEEAKKARKEALRKKRASKTAKKNV